eukprot:scaffold1401_cov180-Ochromonas_danica.AAC.16
MTSFFATLRQLLSHFLNSVLLFLEKTLLTKVDEFVITSGSGKEEEEEVVQEEQEGVLRPLTISDREKMREAFRLSSMRQFHLINATTRPSTPPAPAASPPPAATGVPSLGSI